MMDGFTSLGTVRTQAIVLLLLAFLAGAFAGGAIEREVVRRARTTALLRSGRGGPGFPAGRGGRARPSVFLDSIGLSAAQHAKIDSIVRKRSARTDSLMKTSRAAYDSTRREIDDVLTAEQRQKLDSLRPRGRPFGGPGMHGAGRSGGSPPDGKKP